MGNLKCGAVDLNDAAVVCSILVKANTHLAVSSSYYELTHKSPYYFTTPHRNPPSAPGWYIILHGNNPLYVGDAIDLNKRLNSDNGSSDDFAKNARKSDSKRNFIKKLAELTVLDPLRVAVIPESALMDGVVARHKPLSKLDRRNIEKLLDVNRSRLTYT